MCRGSSGRLLWLATPRGPHRGIPSAIDQPKQLVATWSARRLVFSRFYQPAQSEAEISPFR